MFIKKDSLLLRIISYNGIAIVIVASIMATLFGIMIFNELNMRLLDKSRERTLLVNKAYLYYIDKSREHLYDASTDAVNLVLVDSNDKLLQNRLASAVRNQLSTESYALYGKSFIPIFLVLSASAFKGLRSFAKILAQRAVLITTANIPTTNIMVANIYFITTKSFLDIATPISPT